MVFFISWKKFYEPLFLFVYYVFFNESIALQKRHLLPSTLATRLVDTGYPNLVPLENVLKRQNTSLALCVVAG
jgi:hypothetical protein